MISEGNLRTIKINIFLNLKKKEKIFVKQVAKVVKHFTRYIPDI
jgi:hypothetical protein